MGGFKSKLKLKEKDLNGLVLETNCKLSYFLTNLVSQQEIEKLFQHFEKISGLQEKDGVIDKKEFQQTLGLKDGLLASRLFALFDINNDGCINFKEFVMAFSMLSPQATIDEKLKCIEISYLYVYYVVSFRIYDLDGDGFISKSELLNILKASLEQFIVELSDEDMEQLVEQTFKEVDLNGDGLISFDEYKSMVLKHPGIIQSLTINSPILETT